MGTRSYAKSRGASDQLREKIVGADITYDDIVREGAKHPEVVGEAWPHAPSFASSVRRFMDGGGMVGRNRDAVEKLIAPWFQPEPQPQVEIEDIKTAVREVLLEILEGHHFEFVANHASQAWRADLLSRSATGSSVDQVISNLNLKSAE